MVGEGDIILQNILSTLALPTHSQGLIESFSQWLHSFTLSHPHNCKNQQANVQVVWAGSLVYNREDQGAMELHPWRYSKVTWTQHRWLSCSKGHGQDDLQRSLPTSAILWFCEGMPGIRSSSSPLSNNKLIFGQMFCTQEPKITMTWFFCIGLLLISTSINFRQVWPEFLKARVCVIDGLEIKGMVYLIWCDITFFC